LWRGRWEKGTQRRKGIKIVDLVFGLLWRICNEGYDNGNLSTIILLKGSGILLTAKSGRTEK